MRLFDGVTFGRDRLFDRCSVGLSFNANVLRFQDNIYSGRRVNRLDRFSNGFYTAFADH